jgi:hypothetical protein
MYALLYTPGVGLAGWDWFWFGSAVVLDVAGNAGSIYSTRQHAPGMKASVTQAHVRRLRSGLAGLHRRRPGTQHGIAL